MFKDKKFLSTFFVMYVALVLQNVITLSVNLADNMMLGAYSEVALAGVATVNQIQFIFQQILFAMGEGLVIFCSQYWGKKQTEPMKKIAATAMYCGVILAIILFVIVSLFPYQLLGVFTPDITIVEEAVSYIGIIRYSYIFFAISMILLATLRSVEVVKIALYLSIVTFFVNCGINYVCIFGRFGIPAMGTKGAAIGTLTARILELIILLVYILKKEENLKLRLSDYKKLEMPYAKDYIKITAPMVFVQGLWGVNTALQTVILGHMNSAAIAANSAAATLFLIVKSMAVGAAATASVIIGKTIGTGDMLKVKLYAKEMQKLFVVIGIIGGIILFFIRIPVLSLYDLSDSTKAMANDFLIILSVVFVGMSYQMPTNYGIIKGGGSPMYVVKVDLISIWLIVIPISFFMAFVVKASPAVVVCCLNADQIFKGIPAYIKANHGTWIKKLTR
ncbi:MAG: MATE family efflux transporter [Lachnospiraceae bacterium]